MYEREILAGCNGKVISVKKSKLMSDRYIVFLTLATNVSSL